MEPEKPLPLPEDVEKIAAGLTREWYAERRVVLYRLGMASDDIVRRWADLVWDTLNAWPHDRPYLALHDLSQPGVSLQYAALVNFDMMNIGVTIEGRVRVERWFDDHPQQNAKVAVNFNLSLSGQTNRTLMNFLSREHPAIRYKTFYNRGKCLKWLLGEITDTSETKSV
jgi:hypothetical protein